MSYFLLHQLLYKKIYIKVKYQIEAYNTYSTNYSEANYAFVTVAPMLMCEFIHSPCVLDFLSLIHHFSVPVECTCEV